MNQEEILESKGLKIGDRVVVTERWDDGDEWDNIWAEEMDEAIGNEYEITGTFVDDEDGNSGYELSFSDSYWFPAQVLERAHTEEEKRIIAFLKKLYTINPEATAWLVQIASDGTWREYSHCMNYEDNTPIDNAAQWLSICDVDFMLCWE